MSKFDFGIFGELVVVSKEKYTKEEAVEFAKREFDSEFRKDKVLYYKDRYVRHRVGRNDFGEPCVGWWIEPKKKKRCCPCWIFCMSKVYKAGYSLLKY